MEAVRMNPQSKIIPDKIFNQNDENKKRAPLMVFAPEAPVEKLGLPRLLTNALIKNYVLTVGDFIKISRMDLVNFRNLEYKYVNFLVEYRQRLKLSADHSEKPSEGITRKPALNSNDLSVLTKIDDKSSIDDTSKRIVLSPDEPLINLELPTRVLNSLTNKGIITAYDLCNASESSLFKIRNIGPKIVAMLIAFRSGIVFDRVVGVENDNTNANQNILIQAALKEENILSDSEMADKLFNSISDQRSIEILKQRYGLLTGEKHTLDEIGSAYGVTRERIRQIQKKTVSRIKKYGSIHTKKLIVGIHNMLWQHGGIMDSNEADNYVNENLGIEKYDGSSFLDLASDLSWLQRFQIKDLIFYTPIPKGEIDFEDFSSKVLELLKKHPAGINVSDIASLLKEFDRVKDTRFNKIEFIRKYCSIDQRLEKIDESTYRAYDWKVLPYYESLIKQVFLVEKMPLHFTEIAYKTNELLKKTGRKLDERRIYSIVLGSEKFAHTGRRGTYGLTEWGIRKELLPVLIEECIKKAGFPLHVDQIFYYVSKYKDTPITNVYASLYSNKKFYRTRDGAYGLRSA